jgi:hypothetical protein
MIRVIGQRFELNDPFVSVIGELELKQERESRYSLRHEIENAKKKGLEMKMTNIDTISGQINSLLNMVNKNKRVTDASTNKSINKF